MFVRIKDFTIERQQMLDDYDWHRTPLLRVLIICLAAKVDR